MVLGIICFCKWWWLLWLLPFILGWLLGKAMNSSWKSKAEQLEKDLAACRSRCKGLEGDLSAAKSRPSVAKAAAPVMAAAAAAPKPKKPEKSGAWLKLKNDNLQIVEGIGPKMNEVLKENGVTTWSVLASKTGHELKAILDKYGDKYQIIDPHDWPAQAKLAAEDRWDDLIKHQSDDGSAAKAKKILIKLGIMKDDNA